MENSRNTTRQNKLNELYSLEKKVITESARHAKLKQEVDKLREQLANTTDTTSIM